MNLKKILLLGSGELGREFTISALKLGFEVTAVDRYENAPAMQVAQQSAVIDMLDGEALEKLVEREKPDIIVPEVEALRTEKLIDLENQGIRVVPCARATHLTMNRDAIRNFVSEELKIKTARFAYAASEDELLAEVSRVGLPCVVKPVMSSSGKGQSMVRSRDEVKGAWQEAISGMRGDKPRVIVEEFIQFVSEITLLTVVQSNGEVIFVRPIGHRQERGDYRESWLPASLPDDLLRRAQETARKVTLGLGGVGIFGVEFFVTKDEVIFSELSPRPHDTGLVTLVSQDLSEFDLHLRAIAGLPIPEIEYFGPSASSVILADRHSLKASRFEGLAEALAIPGVHLRIFGKPSTRPYRRMGVALARGLDVAQARDKANRAAAKVILNYDD